MAGSTVHGAYRRDDCVDEIHIEESLKCFSNKKFSLHHRTVSFPHGPKGENEIKSVLNVPSSQSKPSKPFFISFRMRETNLAAV